MTNVEITILYHRDQILSQEMRMYYRSGTVNAAAQAGEVLRVDWPGGSTFLHEMMSWPP